MRRDVRGAGGRGDRPVRRPQRQHPHRFGAPDGRPCDSGHPDRARSGHHPRSGRCPSGTPGHRPPIPPPGAGSSSRASTPPGTTPRPRSRTRTRRDRSRPPPPDCPRPTPVPPGVGAAQLQIGARPPAQRHQHRAPLPGPGGQPLPVGGPDPGPLGPGHHDHVQPVQQRGGDRQQVGARARDQGQPIQPDPRLGRRHHPQLRPADHPHPGPARRHLGEQRQQQRGGPRPGGHGHRAAPAQPTGREQPGQRLGHRQHPVVGPRSRPRAGLAVRFSKPAQQPAGQLPPVRRSRPAGRSLVASIEHSSLPGTTPREVGVSNLCSILPTREIGSTTRSGASVREVAGPGQVHRRRRPRRRPRSPRRRAPSRPAARPPAPRPRAAPPGRPGTGRTRPTRPPSRGPGRRPGSPRAGPRPPG